MTDQKTLEQIAQERKEADPNYQRTKAMPRDERVRNAIEQQAALTKEYYRKQGKEITDREARKDAERIANLIDRKDGR